MAMTFASGTSWAIVEVWALMFAQRSVSLSL